MLYYVRFEWKMQPWMNDPMIGKHSIRKLYNEEELFLHEIDKLNDPAARVLDLGAGEGSFDYRKYKFKIISVDEELPGNVGHLPENAFFSQCDAAALPFLPEVFDAVIANFVFEHFPKPEAVLKEIQRVSKPDGLLYLSIPNSTSLDDKLFRFLSGDKYHVQNFSFDSLIRLVYKTTNFKLISFADWPAGFTWLNALPTGRLIRRLVLHFLRRIRPLLQKRARRDSGFIFLFKKAGKFGFRMITHVCGNCGGGVTIEDGAAHGWQCLQCGHNN
jgi:SAM-dependent methyltransferase